MTTKKKTTKAKHRVSVDLSETAHENLRKIAFTEKSTVKEEAEKVLEGKHGK